MNLVGKIFVVLIFVMALVFMAMTMAVYTTQRNWREVVMLEQEKVTNNKELGLKYQLERRNRENEELKAEKEKLDKDGAAERTALLQQLTKLQTEYELAKKERRSMEATRADLEKEKRDAVAAMNATQKNASDSRQERDKLRTSLADAQQDRDKHFAAVTDLTDKLNQAVNDKELLRKRTAELAKDLAKANEQARWFGLPDKDSDYKSKAAPPVSAVVTSVHGDGLIGISLGSDAGLRPGHQLEIYRTNGGQNVYVGRVQVVKTDPAESVCKIDPKFQNSNVTVSDRVTSKIQ
jgi:hypothetical protein